MLQHGVDIVSIGEGEDTILELTEYFLGKKELEDVAGVCFRKDDGTIHYTKSRPLIKDLDRLPFPDYSGFPISLASFPAVDVLTTVYFVPAIMCLVEHIVSVVPRMSLKKLNIWLKIIRHKCLLFRMMKRSLINYVFLNFAI